MLLILDRISCISHQLNNMALPLLLIAGAAAKAAGPVLSTIGANQSNKAVAKVTKREIENQDYYTLKGLKAFEQTLPGLGAEQANADLAASEANTLNAYNDIDKIQIGQQQNTPLSSITSDLNDPLRARLRSYNDWQLQDAVKKITLQNRLRKLQDFSQGDARIFQSKVDAASTKGDALDFWGKVIGALGSGASAAGGGFGK